MATFKVRNKDGVQFEVDADKAHLAEADGFLPVVSNGNEEYRVSVSDLSKAISEGYRPIKPVSEAETAYRSGIHGASLGFDDEIAGGIDALGSMVGLHGLGSSPLNEIRRETPEEAGKGIVDVYKEGRDSQRNKVKDAAIANPKTAIGAELIGSLPTGAVGGAGVKGAALLGGAMGLGNSEADVTDGDVAGAARDTLLGAGVGAAGYGAGKVVGKAVSALPEGKEAVSRGIDALKRGAKAGADEASEAAIKVPVVDKVQAGYGALKGSLKELVASNRATDEFKKVAAQAKKVLRAGENGSIGPSLSDEDAILLHLMEPGENETKKWIAQKASMVNPGQGTADEYLNLLGQSSDQRVASRLFDKGEAASQLKPLIEEAGDLFDIARNNRFAELQQKARENFKPTSVGGVLKEVGDAIVDADKLKSVPSSIKNLLADVNEMITNGTGTRQQGLRPGAIATVPNGEKFNRLQKARELLDSKIKWAQGNGENQAESLLTGVRAEIDKALKLSPEKVEADSLFKASKELEGKFFGPTEFRSSGGSIQVDEPKIAKLLGDNDASSRFKKAISEMRDFASREDLHPGFRDRANRLVEELEKNLEMAKNKKSLESFRFKEGPSSPAIQRLQSVTKKNSLLVDAVNAPSGFLGSLDNFSEYLNAKTGKSFSELSEQQKSGAIKFWTWLKRNQDASPEEAARTFEKLLPNE